LVNFTVTTASDIPVAGELTLRQAIASANATIAADTISFDSGLDGSTIRLTQGELAIAEQLTINGDIDGDGAPNITITGDRMGNDTIDASSITEVLGSYFSQLSDNSRIFNVLGVSTATTIIGVTLTGGRTTLTAR
jgi:hypothetical protein